MTGKVWQKAVFRNAGDRILAESGHLPADQVRTMEVDGVVDTGAAMMVIPPDMAARLGLPKVGEQTVRYADLRTATRDLVGQLEVEFQGRRSTYRAIVEP